MLSVNLQFVDVSFRYDTSSEIILSSLNLHFTRGWTGIVGANGVGKTTVAKIAAGILVPSSGHVAGKGNSSAVYCAQETDVPPPDAEEFLSAADSHSGKLRSVLGVGDDWIARWSTLSHGERKRFQIGSALRGDPGILVLDEPANHIDASAKRMLVDALRAYNGTGIVVSHDRDLLDSICSQCLFMRPGRAVMRTGGFTCGEEAERCEDNAKLKAYNDAAVMSRKAQRSARLLKHRESDRKGSLSKKNIEKYDHDAKTKIDAARLTGKDKPLARKARIMKERASALGERARDIYFEKRETDGIIFRGERMRRDRIISIGKCVVPLGERRVLMLPEIVIRSDSRIAVTGDNGAGKSVFVSRIVSSSDIPRDRMIYIPQEIDDRMWDAIRDEISRGDNDMTGMLLTAVYRLGSEPERILATDNPSPGEKRKIMLGLGLMKKPGLIIMDEPTNHMDLPSIRCLEDALNRFEGALVVVSHDRRFLERVTSQEWEISRCADESRLYVRK